MNLKKVSDAANDIKAKNPGILDLPEDGFKTKSVEALAKHFITLAKTKGAAPVMRAILNIERWNKNRDKSLADKARSVINRLEKSEGWEKDKKS